MSVKEKLANMVNESGFEYFTTADARESGIHGQTLKNLVDAGKIHKIDRGIYSFDEYWDDDLYIMQKRFEKGVYSHDTALYLHGYSDRTPFTYDITFPQGYNSSRLSNYNLNVRHVKHENYELGRCIVKTTMGNEVRAYNLERTLCDILRGKGSNVEIINPAMKKYVESKEKNIPLLLEYAEQLRVKAKVLRYMEVLL